jgi:hypothetical protein
MVNIVTLLVVHAGCHPISTPPRSNHHMLGALNHNILA